MEEGFFSGTKHDTHVKQREIKRLAFCKIVFAKAVL